MRFSCKYSEPNRIKNGQLVMSVICGNIMESLGSKRYHYLQFKTLKLSFVSLWFVLLKRTMIESSSKGLEDNVKDLTTRHTCAGMAQKRPTDPKRSKPKIVMIQQTKSKTRSVYTRCHDIFPQQSFKLKSPGLHWLPFILATQNLNSDPPNKFYQTNKTKC